MFLPTFSTAKVSFLNMYARLRLVLETYLNIYGGLRLVLGKYTGHKITIIASSIRKIYCISNMAPIWEWQPW